MYKHSPVQLPAGFFSVFSSILCSSDHLHIFNSGKPGINKNQECSNQQKEHRKRLPIIAVTARAMFGDKERILENKLDDYIAKPYNLNTVVETLNKYIGNKEE